MRRSFKREVRDYVIVERYKGKPWKEIVAGVADKFGIEPPSIRIMQSWFRAYQGAMGDPTGVKYVAQVIEDAADAAKPLAQAKMMGEVMPLWSKLQERYKEIDFFDAGWMAFLAFFEAQIGRESFDRIVQRYMTYRDEFIQPSPQRKPDHQPPTTDKM
jgi:hypothetical protein